MKKYKLFFCIRFILCAAKIFCEENIYEKVFNRVRGSEDMLMMQYESDITKRRIFNARLKWLPKFSLETASNSSGFIFDKSVHAFDVDANFIVKQKLLLGSSLRIYANNNLKMLKRENIKHNYNFSTGAHLNIPLYAFAPLVFTDAFRSDFYSYKKETDILLLKNKITTNAFISEVVFYLGEYYIQKEKTKLNDKKLLLLDKINTANTILWEEGKISTLELNEAVLKHENQKSSFIIEKANFETLQSKLAQLQLIDFDINEDFSQWLTEWEALLADVKLERIHRFDLENLQTDASWQHNVTETMQKVPNFFLACNFKSIDPPLNSYTSSFRESIREPFENKNDFRWTISLGFNMSFNPFTESTQINRNFRDMKKIYKIKKMKLDKQHREELNNVRNRIFALKEMIKSKQEALKITEWQYEKAKVLNTHAKLSDYDLEMQKIFVDESRLEFFRSRLQYITELINFY